MGGDRLVMVIFLPETFPLNTRPVIKIFFSGHGGDDHQRNVDFDTKVTNPWLDINSSSVIGSPGLNTFGVHSELGRVVQAIKREFEKNPPRKMFMVIILEFCKNKICEFFFFCNNILIS